MPMNRVQFQKGLSLAEFLGQYGREEQCEAALEALRWPEGFRCPACGGAHHTVFERSGRKYWQCGHCRKQTTLTAGTIFESTKLPLTSWFLAMYLLTQAKNNVSALELMRHLGVCYRTAWLVKHKLIQVMAEQEADRQLTGRVEIDDAYLGGERSGKRGRGSENKVSFVMAVQTTDDGHPWFVRLDPLPFTQQAIANWAQRALAPSTYALTDGLSGFRSLHRVIAGHQRLILGSGRSSAQHPAFRWVNTLLSNLKTALSGTYHAIKFEKYARRYLAEFQYRFNRRFDLKILLQRLARAAVLTHPRAEWRLRLAEVHR
ncbi:IS1595 family transposase [Methylocaldum szegediense]|uniref:Transposase n=1 Tax=Methylocaldum szegediense TaxID=73780 RepID=A0ABM9HWW4_9GAMM|nr:IS1595 family transposase [Methylocaldum szegediense]CAI8740176.1 transposase [Methylocaldum szegediense]